MIPEAAEAVEQLGPAGMGTVAVLALVVVREALGLLRAKRNGHDPAHAAEVKAELRAARELLGKLSRDTRYLCTWHERENPETGLPRGYVPAELLRLCRENAGLLHELRERACPLTRGARHGNRDGESH